MRILFEIVTDQSQTAARIEALRQQVKNLNKDIAKKDQSESNIKQYTKELVKAKSEIDQLKRAQKDLNKEFSAARVPKDSVIGMRLEYGRLIDKINLLTEAERKADAGKALISRAAALKQNVDSIEQSVGRFTGQVGNYQKALLGIGDIVTGGPITGGLFALVDGFKRLGGRILDVNAEVSDSIADVAKASETSIDFVNELADSLEKRNTRTSLVDQLGIAEIGGKLGVAKQDLFGFVEAVDVVNVALGDQFGGSVEQTTEVIGKLRNVLLDVKTDNIGKDITGIGNALNYLEAQGAASAGTIADFAGRIGGVASPLGVSAGKILGVSTTLDELAVNAERGSSAFVRILQRVAVSPAAFAKAAGVSADEFTKLVNEDLFGAVTLFLGKLNDRNLSNTELQKVLKELKLNGVGTAEVVGKLGSNLDLLDKRVGQSTKSLGESSSVTQEFEKKNATLGATLEKLRNSFDNLFTNSAFGGAIAEIVQSVVDLVNEFAVASDKLFDFTAAEDGATRASEIFEDSLKGARTEIEKGNIATEKNFNILRDGSAPAASRNKAIADLIKLYPNLLTQQQLESANIQQLNGLQVLATDVLRRQITERLKLRAKENIETQIVQKKIRLAELDATPDRALLGELTAGETVRNFGTLDPKKLRADLFAQFTIDIAQLEEAGRRADAVFKKVAGSAEDNLSPEEQDKLDLFRQFNEGGKLASKTVDKTTGSITGLSDQIKEVGKRKKDIDYAADSLEALREKVKKAREELEKSAQLQGKNRTVGIGGANPFNKQLIEQLRVAEQELALLEAQLKRATDFSPKPGEAAPGTDALDAATRELSGASPAVDGTIELSDAIRESIIQNNAVAVDDTQFTAKEIQQIFELLAKKKISLTEDELKAVKDANKERKEIEKAAIESGISTAQAVASAVFEIQRNRAQREKDEEIAKLDELYQKRIDDAAGNAALQESLTKELEEKKAEIEKAAAKKRKEAAIKEAVINTAVAIVKSLTGAPFPVNLILAAATAVAGAAQIAVINSQSFAEGGFTGAGSRKDATGRRMARAYQKGDTTIQTHQDEYIATTDQIRRMPWLFEFLEKDRLGMNRPFAAGGFTSDFTPQIAVPGAGVSVPVSVQSTATFSPDDVKALGGELGGIIAAEVARQIRPALADGLGDANRRLEREQQLDQQREI